MDSIKIELKPRTPSYSVNLEDGGTALVAYAKFTRPDGSFSGLGLSLQASPLIECIAPDAADAEMFFRAVALLNAAPKLLEALNDVVISWEKGDDVFGGIQRARAAIALATTHPLHDAMEAEQREYELAAESRRPVEHDDDRDHLTDDNTDFGDDLDEAARAYSVGADDIDPETLQDAADHARKSAVEERLLGGAA